MQQWTDIIKMIGDFGMLLVVAGIAVKYVIDLLTSKQKREKAQQEREDAKLKGYDELLTQLLSRKLAEAHLSSESENNDINENIVSVMTEAMHEVGACRVLFFSYHNGGQDYEGRSYQRMSCINEVTTSCVPIQGKYGNMFRTSMFYIYTELNKNNYFNIPNINLLQDKDPGLYYMLKEDNIHATFGCGIHNRNGQIIGFLMYDFSAPQEERTQEIIAAIKRKSYIIEGIYLMDRKG